MQIFQGVFVFVHGDRLERLEIDFTRIPHATTYFQQIQLLEFQEIFIVQVPTEPPRPKLPIPLVASKFRGTGKTVYKIRIVAILIHKVSIGKEADFRTEVLIPGRFVLAVCRIPGGMTYEVQSIVIESSGFQRGVLTSVLADFRSDNHTD